MHVSLALPVSFRPSAYICRLTGRRRGALPALASPGERKGLAAPLPFYSTYDMCAALAKGTYIYLTTGDVFHVGTSLYQNAVPMS